MLAGMTGDKAYLAASREVAAKFIADLPSDGIPLWDVKAPGADQPKDASASAIASYGFQKLHALTGEIHYREIAERLLRALAEHCGNDSGSGGLLLHATADLPHGLGIDESTMYGDYYYLKSLVALQKAQ
jgi:unsaturated chondroitin disaccharide hydrolase